MMAATVGDIGSINGSNERDQHDSSSSSNNTSITVLLKDQFSLFPKVKPSYEVSVTKKQISCIPLTAQYQNPGIILKFCDIIGCDCMKGKTDLDTNAYVTLYCYIHRKKIGSKRFIRKRFPITLTISKFNTYEENSVLAGKWHRIISAIVRRIPLENMQDVSLIPPQLPPPRRLLVFVNPFSGPGKALTIFQQRVVPILAEAGLHFNMVITERQNHAREIVRNMKITEFYGIVIVSGDGLIYEVVNGLMDRPDWERAIKIPIGALPGGSGNALCCAINYAGGETFSDNFALHSSFVIAKHSVVPMDLVAVDTVKERIYSFLSVTWGIIADVDIESERYRSLGSARFTFGAVARLVNLRKYKGRLSFLPVDTYVPKNTRRSRNTYMKRSATISMSEHSPSESSSRGRPRAMSATGVPPDLAFMSEAAEAAMRETSNGEENRSNGEESPSAELECVPNSIGGATNGEHLGKSQLQQQGSTNDESRVNFTLESSGDQEAPGAQGKRVIPTPLLVPLNQPVPDNWVTIEDDFIWVLGAYQSHLATDTFVTPEGQLDDGVIFLSFIRGDVSRSSLLQVLLSLEGGTVYSHSCVEMVKVHAFRLEPLVEKGILCVDGEQVDFGPIQAQVLPSFARIMALPQDH